MTTKWEMPKFRDILQQVYIVHIEEQAHILSTWTIFKIHDVTTTYGRKLKLHPSEQTCKASGITNTSTLCLRNMKSDVNDGHK
jgi:hypothetical protein